MFPDGGRHGIANEHRTRRTPECALKERAECAEGRSACAGSLRHRDSFFLLPGEYLDRGHR